MTVPTDIADLMERAGAGDGLTIGVSPCNADPDYFSDIATGTQVKVRDAAGKMIGLGKLESGIMYGAEDEAVLLTKCRFNSSVAGVPGGEKFYSLEVADRGQVNYTAIQFDDVINIAMQR